MSLRFKIAVISVVGIYACDPGTLHVVRSSNGKIRQMWTEKGPSGQRTVREGLFKSLLPDGRLESTIEYHDGMKNGDANFWSMDGHLSFQGRYQGDFLVHEKRFNPQGELLLERSFKVKKSEVKALGPDGDSILAGETCAWTDEKHSQPVRHGLCKLTYANGVSLANRYYQFGHLHGPVTAWFPDGKLWMAGAYERDIPTGTWKTWTPGGKPLWSFTFSQGLKNGLSEEWFPDGKVKSKGFFKLGKQEGPYQEWYPNGKIRMQTEFQSGKRIGQEITWYPNGTKLYSAMYSFGKLEGDFYQWYPGGHMRLHCRFHDGKKEGPSRVWYRQGTVLELANFHQGRLNGSYRTWGPDGNPLSSKEFRDGTVAFDSKAKELLELLGADQIRVPVGLLGFYWGMSFKDCRSNLSLLQATNIHAGEDELTAHLVAFVDHHPSEARVRVQFNAQGELWGIKLDVLQKNSADCFTICENLETEIGSELGTTGLRKGEGVGQYYITRKKEWGKFTVTTGTGEDSSAAISAVLPVVSAEAFSPGDKGWFRFSLANHLYREYANPANAEITPPSWPEEAFLAGR